MVSILILNGPNLNLLGRREPELYGEASLEHIEKICCEHAAELGVRISFLQSNHEGELVESIQSAQENHDGLIFNAAAYTHTSVALADAIRAVDIPTIEVHLSNIYAREAYRHHSFIAPVAVGSICGFGSRGYVLALDAMTSLLNGS